MEREKELNWLRGELEKAQNDVSSHSSAAAAAAENQRQVEERAAAFTEEVGSDPRVHFASPCTRSLLILT